MSWVLQLFFVVLELSTSVLVTITTGVDDLTQLTRFFGHDDMLRTSTTSLVIVSFGTGKIGVGKVEPRRVPVEWVSLPSEVLSNLIVLDRALRNNCFTGKFLPKVALTRERDKRLDLKRDNEWETQPGV